MTIASEIVSADEIRQRRRKLLEDAGITRDQLEELSAEGRLSDEDQFLLDDVRSLSFLLGE